MLFSTEEFHLLSLRGVLSVCCHRSTVNANRVERWSGVVRTALWCLALVMVSLSFADVGDARTQASARGQVGAAVPNWPGLVWRAERGATRLLLYGVSHTAEEGFSELPLAVQIAYQSGAVVVVENSQKLPFDPEFIPAELRSVELKVPYGFELDADTDKALDAAVSSGWVSAELRGRLTRLAPLDAHAELTKAIASTWQRRGLWAGPKSAWMVDGGDAQLEAMAFRDGRLAALESHVNVYRFWAKRCGSATQNSTLVNGALKAAQSGDYLDRLWTHMPRAAATGDDEQLRQHFDWMMAHHEHQSLIHKCMYEPRTAFWADVRIGQLIAAHPGKTLLIAVGAAHLVKSRVRQAHGLLEKLRQSGFRVERVATPRAIPTR